MKVNVDELDRITSLLLMKFRENIGNEIELTNDFYWDISDSEIYNPYNEPENISLGQLSDDLEEINRLRNSDSVIPYDLRRIANVLKALSIENQISF